ncbi:MAG: OmpA family protein [Desulfobacteraceae bacterium]|nr:OmpA family protein [Desulfobacteraceae bacterium]
MAWIEDETPKPSTGAPAWMVTFGDMMSLLLCFFILLLSFSEMDRQKYKQVAGSLEKAFGVKRATQIMDIPKGMTIITQNFDQEIIEARIREDLSKEIDDQLANNLEEFKDQITMESSENQVVIRMMGESTFDSGSVEIRDKLKPLLINVAKVLEQDKNNIIIAGHTDDVPVRTGPYRSNLRLSIARAAVVAEFLLANSTIDPKRIATMGFGEFRPIGSNRTERGREMNRRVEIILGGLPDFKR